MVKMVNLKNEGVQMKHVRKRFWGYLTGVLFSVGMLMYGVWSLSMFRSLIHLIEVAADIHIPIFHPVRVWGEVGRLYVRISGNWDPAAAADVIMRGMFTMIFTGIALFLMFLALLIRERAKHSGNMTNHVPTA